MHCAGSMTYIKWDKMTFKKHFTDQKACINAVP